MRISSTGISFGLGPFLTLVIFDQTWLNLFSACVVSVPNLLLFPCFGVKVRALKASEMASGMASGMAMGVELSATCEKQDF